MGDFLRPQHRIAKFKKSKNEFTLINPDFLHNLICIMLVSCSQKATKVRSRCGEGRQKAQGIFKFLFILTSV